MTAVECHVVLKLLLPLFGALVTRICDPPIRLQEHRRSEVLLRVPPVRRARGRAASAQDTFVQPIQLLSVFFGLPVFAAIRRWRVSLEVGLDRLVLFVEEGEIRDKVFDNVGMGKRVYAGLV